MRRNSPGIRLFIRFSLMAAAALLLAASCGSNKKELTVVVGDRDGNRVRGIQIFQAGGPEKPIGETDGTGRAVILLQKPKAGPLRLRLVSPKGTDGDLYHFVTPPNGLWDIPDLAAEPDYKKFLVDQAGAGEPVAADAGTTPPATPTQASLRVLSTPSGARILLDGNEQGTTPATLTGLTPGRAHLELRLSGYQAHGQDLVLLATAGTDTVSADLQAEAKPATGAETAPHPRTETVQHPVTETAQPPATGTKPRPEGGLPGPGPGSGPGAGGSPGPGSATNGGPSGGPGSGSHPAEEPTSGAGKITFSVSTSPGWAEVYVDDRPENLNITGRFAVSLVPGPHRFRLYNAKAGVDQTLNYTVNPHTASRGLVLDWERKAVVERGH